MIASRKAAANGRTYCLGQKRSSADEPGRHRTLETVHELGDEEHEQRRHQQIRRDVVERGEDDEWARSERDDRGDPRIGSSDTHHAVGAPRSQRQRSVPRGSSPQGRAGHRRGRQARGAVTAEVTSSR